MGKVLSSKVISKVYLLITNESNMTDNLAILNPMGKSDHGGLIFDYNCYGEKLSIHVGANEENMKQRENIYDI